MEDCRLTAPHRPGGGQGSGHITLSVQPVRNPYLFNTIKVPKVLQRNILKETLSTHITGKRLPFRLSNQ
jgi:hypothetical protein